MGDGDRSHLEKRDASAALRSSFGSLSSSFGSLRSLRTGRTGSNDGFGLNHAVVVQVVVYEPTGDGDLTGNCWQVIYWKPSGVGNLIIL